MTFSIIKRKVAIQATLYFLFSAALISSLTYIMVRNKQAHSDYMKVEDKVHFIELQIVETHERNSSKEMILNQYSELWSSSKYKYVDNLKFELKQQYKKYCILNSDISIPTQEEVDVFYTGEYTRVIKNKVISSFSAVSDKHIFLFLQAIPNLPGYIFIESLVIHKEREIDGSIAEQILNGHMIEMVRAYITFDWYIVLKNED